ncbi:MAG: AAA family ATPase [Leptothrix sp. (in: b-proteobacteria)]
MFIDKVSLTNIRGFKKLEFNFDRGNGQYAGWTVFTGDNGSGKSTLLKAIAIALVGTDSARTLQPSFRRWIHNGEHIGKFGITVAIDISIDAAKIKQKKPNQVISIELLLGSQTKETEPIFGIHVPDDQVGTFNLEPKFWKPTTKNYFSCGYGPFRRVFGSSPEVAQRMTTPTVERFITLFQESASLAEVDQWLRNLNYKSLEGKPEAKAQLALVLEILRDELLPNQLTIERVDSDGLWLKDRNGIQLAWSDMSDGYRAALALLADILRHLINTYGTEGLTARDADGKLYIQRSGVVLIDEIDAHLHPEWQREIGFWLKRHFPNIQFLVTSHSPLICQAADPNGLFVLPEPGSDLPARALTQEEYQEVISSRPDTILRSPAFGLQNTRSQPAVDARASYARLKTKQRAGAQLSAQEKSQLEDASRLINPDEEP